MEEKKTDRRVRRTRKLLVESLTSLMKEKDVKDISVKELSERADINRGTFYLHYKDVFDMLEQVEDELFRDFNRILDDGLPESKEVDPKAVLQRIFQFLRDNRNIVEALIGPHGDYAFINRMKALVQKRLYHIWEIRVGKPEHFDFYFAFYSSGCIGLMTAWRENNWEPSPEVLADFADRLVNHVPLKNGANIQQLFSS